MFLETKNISNTNSSSLIQNVTDSINNTFSATCKRYTDVMAHKHELQRLLFMMKDEESSLSANVTSLIINLENGASKLQSFTVCLLSTYNNCLHYIIILSVLQLRYYGEPCVEFTANQYHDIFNSRFQDQGTIDAALSTFVENYMNKTNNCCTWDQYSY